MLRRRSILSAKSNELYPIGTDIVLLYLGGTASSKNFVNNKIISTETGEYIDGSGRASPIYMEMSPQYKYMKTGSYPNRGYLKCLAYYDENYNFIGYYSRNSYESFEIPELPAGTKYARICTNLTSGTNGIGIERIE